MMKVKLADFDSEIIEQRFMAVLIAEGSPYSDQYDRMDGQELRRWFHKIVRKYIDPDCKEDADVFKWWARYAQWYNDQSEKAAERTNVLT